MAVLVDIVSWLTLLRCVLHAGPIVLSFAEHLLELRRLLFVLVCERGCVVARLFRPWAQALVKRSTCVAVAQCDDVRSIAWQAL